MEIGRTLGHPFDEGGDFGVRAERLRRRIFDCEFAFAEDAVNLPMADRMNRDRRAAALGSRDQVVLFASFAERTQADRAHLVGRHGDHPSRARRYLEESARAALPELSSCMKGFA